jgi:hypothetical protein
MTDEIDAASVVGEVILLRDVADSTIIIVEGADDFRFFSPFVKADACKIVISFGRSNGIEALSKLRSDGYKGVLTVIDRDLDDYFDGPPSDLDIVVTDDVDIEIMMIRSSAFDRLIAELASPEKLAKVEEEGQTPRHVVLSSVHRIGLLRLYSRLKGLNLRFRDLNYSFVGRELEYTSASLITAVLDNSRKPRSLLPSLLEGLSALEAEAHDPWRTNCGHDLTEFIGRALRRLFGSQNAIYVSASEIESRLRLAFSEAHFRACSLFRDICQWEARNEVYPVLKR